MVGEEICKALKIEPENGRFLRFLVHFASAAAAEAIAAHSIAAPHRRRFRFAALRMRGESGVFLFQMIVPARWACNGRTFSRSPHQLLEFCSAVIAGVFKDRHNATPKNLTSA
jgi:hypothetical protein